MTARELLIQEIAGTPGPILAEVYQYLRFLKTEQAAERFNGLVASQSALAKDWVRRRKMRHGQTCSG
jgi:hypothetical protein